MQNVTVSQQNGELYIQATLDSVVINGGSMQNTRTLLAGYNPRLTISTSFMINCTASQVLRIQMLGSGATVTNLDTGIAPFSSVIPDSASITITRIQ